MKPVLMFVAVLAALSASPDYDPVKILPDAYTLQFENDWVKVVRVRYAPYAKLPAHAHTPRASAYVYLNDAPPVVFRHVGEKKFAATRPATRAGSFRVFRGIEEIHEVENTGSVASEFLRVEFKTEAKELQTLKGRFHREPGPAGTNSEVVQFENAQVRISRSTRAAGRSLPVVAIAGEHTLLIELSPRAGAHRWVTARAPEEVVAPPASSAEWLRFDLKTRPN